MGVSRITRRYSSHLDRFNDSLVLLFHSKSLSLRTRLMRIAGEVGVRLLNLRENLNVFDIIAKNYICSREQMGYA